MIEKPRAGTPAGRLELRLFMTLSDDSVFRVAAESAPTGIGGGDEGGAILFVNHQIETIFGYAAEEQS